MRLAKTKAMAFSIRIQYHSVRKVESMIAQSRTGEDWVQTVEQHYMCCEHVPLEEMESDDPGVIAEWFMKESRKQHWQQRQMRPLGHMDIIAVGESLYMVHDKFSDDVDHYCETPLFSAPDFTLITLKESK